MGAQFQPSKLVQLVFETFWTVPARGLLIAGAVGILSAAFDIVHWLSGADGQVGLAAAAATVVLAAVAGYAICMTILERPLSPAGAVRFLITTFVMVAPLVLGVVAVMWAAKLQPGGATAVLVALPLIVGGVIVALLPAWPLAQALSTDTVNPIRLLAATRGHRWQLFGLMYLPSIVSKNLPSISPSHDWLVATGIAFVDGVVGAALTAFTACVAVSAWKLAGLNGAGAEPVVAT